MRLFKKKNKNSLKKNPIINYFNTKLLEIEFQNKYCAIYDRLEKNKDLYSKYLNQEPILTICMPAYNGQNDIVRALESILMQETTYKYKIWIFDDCSTDNTLKIAKAYKEKYPDIFEIFENEKNECGKTVGYKIYNSVKTKYWMNVDQDDYWLSKDKMQRFLDFLESHPDYTMASSNIIVKGNNVFHKVYNGDEKCITVTFYEYPVPKGILMQTSATMYRNVFTKEDLDLINSYKGKEEEPAIWGDTFRNIYALSKGKCHYENSIDSVYTWTESGTWSKLNEGQQEFYNLEQMYLLINFFKKPEHKKQMKLCAQYYLKRTDKKIHMLNEEELKKLEKFKKVLNNAI